MAHDTFGTLQTLKLGKGSGSFYSLPALARKFPNVARLPVSIRIVLEAVLRNVDGNYRWFLVSAQFHKNEDASASHWYLTASDIHERVLTRLQLQRNFGMQEKMLDVSVDCIKILRPDGTLDRQAVADVVFVDADALADLNAIVHPAVGAEIAGRLAVLAETDDVVILDVPLLVESGRDDMAGTIVVDTDPEVAVERLVAHRGFAEADARARIARQASREDRLAKADFVIDNGGDLDALTPQIDRCWAWIEGLRPA